MAPPENDREGGNEHCQQCGGRLGQKRHPRCQAAQNQVPRAPAAPPVDQSAEQRDGDVAREHAVEMDDPRVCHEKWV
jgi:hypothetical protein